MRNTTTKFDYEGPRVGDIIETGDGLRFEITGVSGTTLTIRLPWHKRIRAWLRRTWIRLRIRLGIY